MPHRTRIPALAAALLLGLATTTASAAAPATAAPGHAARRSPHTIYSGVFKEARHGEVLTTVATCPPGQFATGGGSWNYDYDQPNTFTVSSYGGDDFWVTQANQIFPSSTTTSVISEVVCSPAPHTALMEPEGAGVEIPANGVATHIARCPAGQVPSGGGPRTSNGLILTSSSIPFNDGWAITAKNVDASPGHLWVNVTCATVPHPVTIGQTQQIPSGGHVSAKADCPQDRVLTGGGVQTSDGSVYVRDVYPSEDAQRVARFWEARAVNTSATPQTVTAWAICTTP
ncbi:hypothetical protein [Yinghuangia seranimata]|uniref:hypothetical protein n=1 Tax=Yinghuangia seranimata TaxID=408067 RepID=UPI00248C4BE0|nr:hypothetical protein [Yinghuangia seranimata]MDI2124553.1 hypothetical protein [Yinghuangia seranimata]